MSGLLPLAEAQARLLGLAGPLGTENIAIEAAVGRYLAADLAARRTQPAADLSAMDGYAVGADDLVGPWAVIGESAAGHPFGGTLRAGEAARISTGAVMPAGSGAVLLQENATRDGELLSLNGEGVPERRHIRRRGFDFADGDVVLDAGTRLGAAQLGLVIAAGHTALTVGRLASLAVLDSGDELAVDAAELGDHRIPASNGPMLAALAAPFAASVSRIGPVPDTLEALTEAFERAAHADVIVTTGGASVGDHDLIRPALEMWGAEIEFWRVAMRPGKPLLVARKGSQWVLGLPGNPVSSYVTAYLFLLPLLRRLAGAGQCLPLPLVARTTAPLPPGHDRIELLRGRLSGADIEPFSQRDSSALRTLASANALIERPIGTPEVPVGGEVRVYPLENGGVA